jgi:hypothetical protein
VQKKLPSDFVWQNWRVSVKSGIFTVRDLRSILVGAAYDLKLTPESRYLCVLADGKFTSARLKSELQAFKDIISPQIAERIYLALFDRDEGFVYFPEECGIPQNELRQFIQEQVALTGKRSPGATRNAVLNLLALQWLNHGKPQTTEALCQASGASYPTVFNAIKQLEAENLIVRQSDRRVSLKRFPENLWKRWVVDGEARKSIRFSDRSGQPRTPLDLAERLQRLNLPNIAIGGVIGAKHYYPKLDITGSPRLDLVVHGGVKSDLEFIKKMDPALGQMKSLVEPANVVVHFLPRAESMFIKDSNGSVLADPIECLANLYQGGLDYQGEDMLSALMANRKEVM